MSEDKDRDMDGTENLDEEQPAEPKRKRKPDRKAAPPPEPKPLPHDPRARAAIGPERTLARQLGMPAFFLGLLVLIFGIGWAILAQAVFKPGPLASTTAGVLLLAYGIFAGLIPLIGTFHGRGSLVVLMCVGLSLALLLLLVGVNALSVTFGRRLRLDMTKTRYYSLSAESLNIARKVEKDVKVTLVVASNQMQFASYDLSKVRKLLREYERASRRIKSEEVDLFKNPKKAEELNVSFGGKAIVESEGRREEVTLTDDSEEGLTTAVYRVTNPEKSVVYYLTGHGELKLEQFGSGQAATGKLRQALDNLQMDVKELVLARDAAATATPSVTVAGAGAAAKKAAEDVPPDAKALLILGPQTPLSRKEMDAIRRYASQPGAGVLLALSYQAGAPDFQDFLSQYKVTVKPGIAIDPYSTLDQGLILAMQRPSGHEVLDRVMMAWMPLSKCFSVESAPPQPNPYGGPPETPPEAAKALLQTSDVAWDETSSLAKGAKLEPSPGEARGPLTTAVVIDTAEKKPPTPPGMPEPPEEPKQPGTRVVVLGSYLMLTDDYLSMVPLPAGGNLTFVSQVVSWLTGGTPISIPAKKPYTLTITYSKPAQILISTLVILLIPLGIVALGIAVWWVRR